MKTRFLAPVSGRLARWAARPRLSAAMFLIALLSACGGGGAFDVAGVGSGGSGVASGTVTGFGSVIVDGVEYDDSSASRQSEDATGSLANAPVKLGQQVQLNYSGSRVAQRIEVIAQLLGPVTAAPGSDGRLAVMGQPVRVVTSVSDASQSTPTVLDGYAVVTAIAAGDEVEVHGAWVYDSAVASNVLVATRVEKRSVAADPVQLGGVVTAVGSGTLRLNSATGTQVSGSGLAEIAVGQVVRVWAARSALAASPVVARRVAVQGVTASELGTAGGTLSGLASQYDPASRSVSIQGVRVKLPDSMTVDSAALARGEFVTVQVTASGSTLVASTVAQRSGSAGADLGRTVEVKGVTRGIDWSATAVSFTLRDTPIVAAAAAIDASCRSVSPTASVYVEVRGALAQSAATVTANSVKCSQSVPGSATVDYTGTIAAIDASARTLTLRVDVSGASVSGTWDAQTYFEQRPASLPVGLRVEVEGVMDQGSSTLRLSKVRLED